MDIAAGQPLTCDEAHVWKTSAIGRNRSTLIADPYCLFGGSGYPLSVHIITPFVPDPPDGSARRQFNVKHSSTRIIIGCAFARLKLRFRILLSSNWRRLTLEEYVRWFAACCIVHNMCITYDHDITAPLEMANPGDGVDGEGPDRVKAVKKEFDAVVAQECGDDEGAAAGGYLGPALGSAEEYEAGIEKRTAIALQVGVDLSAE
jgi:hypothetical protein